MLDIKNLGLLGVFIAGAIPWMEAIAVVPAGILVGLDPIVPDGCSLANFAPRL